MADKAIDVIYSSHSLEPNGGREAPAIKEMLRVARKAVILIEPIYELAPEKAQKRMKCHGYVRNLKATAEKLGAKVIQYGLLKHYINPLNPSGVVAFVKKDKKPKGKKPSISSVWQCPLTGTRLKENKDLFYAEHVGIAYPVLRGVLRAEHGVLASQIDGRFES